ncbi:probable serine/threonine-protein kinase DDB_G0282963 isoform X3 [Contarinia nasturtii]|uniref:probable serine/threonine-protein kinase DDB_G0282963 isoform X3 n=1 Tax=Contarinia nasturtii TaxID=265458 RepID=UPI0012D44FCD|nr:probable serine/threonine-protein kinase DDB_G0282963 isoform X3 [Contarinia nasturtii]
MLLQFKGRQHSFCFVVHLKFKKITDKKKITSKKLSSSADNLNIDLNSNITQPEVRSVCQRNSIQQADPFDCCSVCQNPINIAVSDRAESIIENIVSCRHCLLQTCKSPQCSIWLQEQNCWECSNCHHFDSVVYVQAYDWIFDQLNQRFDAKSIDAHVKNIPPINEIDATLEDDVMLKLNDETSPIPLQQRVRVREFIEDLLASMLGGTLDNVCVGQIYKNLEYLKFFLLFHCELSTTIYKLEVSLHQALSSDLPILEHDKNPGVSYENLRKIVHTIVQEVIKLPEFYNQKGFSSVDANQVKSSFEPKIYEDLLATAVINKIVETYNDKKYENSSGIHSGGSDLDSSCHIDQTNPNFILNSRCSSTELKSEYSAFNERFRSPSMKTADIIDEIFREKLGKENYQSSASASASAHSELSDYIQNHRISLPNFEFNENDIEDDDSEEIEQEFQSIYANSTGFETNFNDISDNWLFRKVGSGNCMNGSTSSIVSASSPVGMLVPSPTQDCRTLIGNRNADEISDLSENGSDIESLHAEHSDNDLKRSRLNAYDLPHVLVESKTLIGGKNEMNSFEQSKAALIDLLEPDSLVSEQSLTGQSPAISEAKNNLILIEDRTTAIASSLTNKRFTTMDNSIRSVQDQNSDLLIKFDSLEAYESDDTHTLNENEKNQREYDPYHEEDINRFTDECGSSSTVAADTITKNDDRISLKMLSSLNVNEEFNDSLEVNTTDRDSVQDIDDDIKGEPFDIVEQDSLETTKLDVITSNNNVPEFLPFAQIGSSWSNDECPAQNSTSEFSSSTNQLVEIDKINNKTNEFDDQTNNTITTNQSDNQDYRDLPGSIAEREHMKWQNAVELPNNPYSAEALQRRLSQSSNTKFLDIERLTGKCETNIKSTQLNTTNQTKANAPIKVVLNSNRMDSERYRRDYYINDAKSASGSRALKTSGDLNRHRTIDDDDDDNNADDYDDDNNGYNTLDNDTNDDSLHIGDIEVVSTTQTQQTYSNHLENQTETLRKVQPIQVDESDPILNKATKLDHLCTEDRDYFLLQSNTVTAEEYAKLSLDSETTDDSHVQQLSLPHCDDSLSTTVSEESECTAAVRVYDLNKRETKILRHDIIKRSRNPIGGETINSFDNFGNCCSETYTKERSDSPLQTTIKQLNSRLLENVNETRKPPRSPTKLKSTHLNRNPRKLKMSDVQLMNDAFGTSLDPKIIDELKRKNGEIDEVESTNVTHDFDKNLINATEQLLDKEREFSKVSKEFDEEIQCQESDIKQQSDESTVSDCENAQNVLVNASANCESTNTTNVQDDNENIENNCVTTECETMDLLTSHSQTTIESPVPISNNQIQSQVTNYERNHEVIVQVNEHKEKSVIEEDVIGALPSVKELARTFSTKTNTVPEKLHRPKRKLTNQMAWRSSYNGSNNNDVNVKDQNGNDSSSNAPPNFNHSYHPMAPGYSITARSLSTKFREELKNATDEGRSSPERPSSPVLVPGILKNNVAFFENLRNK